MATLEMTGNHNKSITNVYYELKLYAGNSTPVVIIKQGGEIWVNPEYNVTEAAQAFWQTVITIAPQIFMPEEKEKTNDRTTT